MATNGCVEEGTKPKVATSTIPSRGPTSGQNCCITPAFSGVPRRGDSIKSGYITLAFQGAHKWVELLRHHCHPGGPQKSGQNQKWVHHRHLAQLGLQLEGGGSIEPPKFGGGVLGKVLNRQAPFLHGEEAPLCLLFMPPHYGEPQEGRDDVATLDFVPSCAFILILSPCLGTPKKAWVRQPFLILLPALGVGDPQECKGDVAFPPSFGLRRKQC